MIKQIGQVLEQVRQDDLGKEDFNLQVQDLSVNERTGKIEFVDKHEGLHFLTMNEHALGQLSSRMGIPVNYARKCMEENPELFARHANYWMNKDDMREKKWFVRAKGDVARAFLTDRYSTLDNSYVLETLEAVLGSDHNVDVKNFSLDPRFFNLRMVFSDMNMNIGTIQKPDDVMVGIHITNSEVGSSSLRIDSCLYRLVCSNGMISRVGGSSLLAQRHANLLDSEMQNRVGKAIAEAVQLGDTTIDRFARLKEVKVVDPLEEIKKLAKNEKYSDKFVDDLQLSYATEKAFTQDDSAFTLVNAFTRSAQNMPTFERRLEVETFAGKLMDGYLK